MSFFTDLIGVAAPIAGSFFGGPVGGAIGSAIGGLVAGGGHGNERAVGRATQQQLNQIKEAQDRINLGASNAQGFLTPFADLGQRGIDLSSFLGSPQEQFNSLQSNPLFQLGLNNANDQTLKSAASRGRLSSGDTLQQLNNNASLVAQPLIDRQRQDILNLLGIGQNTASQQVGIENNAARSIADLMTGAGSTQAAGTIAEQNAANERRGNIFDIGTQLFGNQDVQSAIGNIFSSGGGNFNNVPVGPVR